MPKPWATPEQSAVLRNMLILFRQHHEAGTVAFFWPILYAKWFELWPDRYYDDDKSWEEVRFVILNC